MIATTHPQGWLLGGVLLGSLLLLTGGCGGGGPTQEVIDEQRLKPLVLLYGMYPASNGGRQPANEADLKKYVATRQDLLDRFRTTADQIFLSPRDGKPYKIYYGLPDGYDGVMIHEQEGKNGLRLVGYFRGGVATLPDEEFAKLKLPGK
ncbi:MAG: hypothetical protein SFX18_10835 [Pirellulales bacterium]|nr:hypothetical protein [Pirellulales bacterium]